MSEPNHVINCNYCGKQQAVIHNPNEPYGADFYYNKGIGTGFALVIEMIERGDAEDLDGLMAILKSRMGKIKEYKL